MSEGRGCGCISNDRGVAACVMIGCGCMSNDRGVVA